MGNSITSGGGVLGAGIGGGEENRITGSSCWSTVSGGRRNTIVNVDGRASTVGGGEGNTIDSLGREVIGGGLGNAIERSPNSVIGGGSSNAVRLGDTSEGSQAGCDRGSATISGGANNVIETNSSFSAIGGGSGNDISFSASATIAGGSSNRIVRASVDNSDHATIGGGFGNVIGAGYSTIPGGAQAKTSNYGQLAHASGQFSAAGDAQTSVYVCRGTTTNAEPAELFLNGVAERLMMPTNSTWAFDILVTGRASDGTSAAYHLLGVAKNIAGITTVAAQRKQTILAEDIAAWDATVVAHTTDNSLVVLASGAEATSIRWVATVRTTEVTY
jgi:hypothetical protein